MTSYLPQIGELVVLLLVFLLALALASPVRRRTRHDQRGLGGFAHHLVRPALVLILTPLVAVALGQWPPAHEWLAAYPNHVRAWMVFWAGVATVGLGEAVARQVVAWRGREWPVPELLEDMLRVVLILPFAFLVLRLELGWNIGPLLASTALVTAVLGFALQGVLGNLLAGMSLHLTRTVKQGDWIQVGEVEGRIKRTNWRETRVHTINGHELIVPNSELAGSVIHNLNHPTALRRHRVDVGASYSDAPDEVIAALEEAARAVPDVLEKPAPEAIVTTFEDYGINYRLRYWTRQYHRRAYIDGQVCRHIWYKFKRRGIEIPFPMSDKLLNDFMTVVYQQRKLESDDRDVAAIARDLADSQLGAMVPLDAADFARLAPRVRREAYTHGEVLMAQGDAGESFHVLVSGRLQGRIAGPDEVTFEVGPGAVVGEMSLLTGEPRVATLTVAESSELLTFDREAFVALLGLKDTVPECLADLAASRMAQNRAAADASRAAREQVAADPQERAGVLRRLLGFLGRR
ncbi:MAG: mechanosensitive ion channel family protein [Candidatus Krumholzibacteriia bacterium]